MEYNDDVAISAERRRELDAWMRAHDGVVSRAQIRRLGISSSALGRLVGSGSLTRVGTGVFTDPSRPANPKTDLRASLLAAGRGAVVSHRSAAWLWKLVDAAPRPPSITVPHGRHLDRTLTTIHYTRNPPIHRSQEGFPVTDPARTLVDLAATVSGKPLDALIDRALALGLISAQRLDAVTQPQTGRAQPGVRNLRRRLVLRGQVDVPMASVLEAHTARLLRRLQEAHGIPFPRAELRVAGGRYRLDYAWPEVGLAVEVDGYVWHASAEQLRHDHDRRNQLAMNWTILTFTWVQVVHEPERVMRHIASTYRHLGQRNQRARADRARQD
jgi:very-short-patch-repair endonuclease